MIDSYYSFLNPYFLLAFLGIVLIILEIFVPGGILGAAGAIILVLSVMLITDTIAGFMLLLLFLIIIIALCIYLIVKLIPKDKLRNSLFLFSALSKEEGYNSLKDMRKYKGCIGKTISIMRPIGKVQFGSEILDAVAINSFIEEGKFVEVVDVQYGKIVVSEREV
ncbi:MAG: NfeD family protein [Filifactoraceae bacterium]